MRTTDALGSAARLAEERRRVRVCLRIVSAVLVATLAVGSNLWAQGAATEPPEKQSPSKDYALLYGTVWGPNNQPIGGVLVKVQRQGDKKPKWERVSDRRGEFAVRVPIGEADYTLFAEVKTNAGKKRVESKAHVYSNERVDVSIKLD